MTRLALDHITAVDASPERLVEAAAGAGCDAVCLFLAPMAVLPRMPQFALCEDKDARVRLRRIMGEAGVSLDLAYPFSIGGRTDIGAFAGALDCAADLGAPLVNVLAYDRDAGRRLDSFGAFCDLAATFGLGVAVEFYPPSQIGSLDDALALVRAVSRPGRVGVNVDLLHLMRSGGTIAELAAAPADFILYGQLCDGPEHCPEAMREEEASSSRLLAGEGAFDLAGFVRALPARCPLSVEIPRNAAIEAGESVEERVSSAVGGVRRALEDSALSSRP